MSSSAVAADVFGTLGAVCWSIQLIPQIYQNYRHQSTEGLQPTMMLLWSSAGIPLGIYNITRSFPVALWIQPQILTFLSLLTWIQTQYYPPARLVAPRSVTWCAVVLGLMCGVAGGVEVGVVFALRSRTGRMSEDEVEYYWPVVLMGVLSAVLLCAGVGRHYVDIWRERTVRGISFLFVGIDALGDLTSLISVLFWWKAGEKLDILGLVVYGSELVLWLGVFACAGYFNFPVWLDKKIRQSRAARQTPQQDQADAAAASTDQTELQHQHRHQTNQTHPFTTGAERASTASITSRTSRASRASVSSGTTGSVFRTASSRHAPSSSSEEDGPDHMRLRNVVQLSV